MKNREKYAKEILDIACSGSSIAMDVNGNLFPCVDCNNCEECRFYKIDEDCCENIKKWCEAEYVEKSKISESDRRFLDYLPSEEAWMARDKNGHLYLFCKNKPWKSGIAWYNETDDYTCLNKLFGVDFPMVKWEDSEPWLIEDLKKLGVKK